ncbi:hypothetical protein ACVWXQ_003595 [Bradyrhizobium sp. S3.14.4]
MYQSRNNTRTPWVTSVTVNGTLRKICGKTAADVRTRRGGSPADTRLPNANTSPPTKAVRGASQGPTDAIPSVANSEALKDPPIPKAL